MNLKEMRSILWNQLSHLLLIILIIVINGCRCRIEVDRVDDGNCRLVSSLKLSVPSSNVTYINDDANVYFTVLLPPQASCGGDSLEQRDTIIYLNAIAYGLDLLNNEVQDGGDGRGSMRQYLPLLHRLPPWPTQIKYGAKLVTVQRATSHSNPANLTCNDNGNGPNHINDLAFFDAAHHFERYSNNTLLEQIPIITLSSKESILTTSFKANLVVNLLDTLDWKHFAIITTKHEDSLYIVKILGKMTHSGHVCISNIFEWQSNSEQNDHQIEENLSTFLSSIERPNTKIPILVMSNDETQVLNLVQKLYKKFPNQVSNHQLFFSLVPSPELLTQLQLLSQYSTVFTLTSQLPDIPEYNRIQLRQKDCKTIDGNEKVSTSEMWRKWLSFLPIRSMLAVSIALNQALNNTCTNHGMKPSSSSSDIDWCPEFADLSRKSIMDYLGDLDGKIEPTWMSFGTIDNAGVFNDLLQYNGDEFRVMKSNYSFESSNCLTSECSSCIKFRQSRHDIELTDDAMFGHKLYGHDGHNNLHILLNEEESSAPEETEADDATMLHVETHEINLGLLLPLHQSGASILECSSELNLPAYYIYEAARWIIEKINQNNYLIPGIEIKLELIDTCSSPFYATQELAHLTSSEAKVQPIAFVSSLPRDHYKQVVEFVSSINYTLIATQDISFMDLKFGPQYGILQTAMTGNNLVHALVEQLKYFGWRYVSVVIDPNDIISMGMFHYLSELTSHEKICFASVEHAADLELNSTMDHLLTNYKNGANVVILLTNFATNANLMAFYQSSLKLGLVKNENLHFISIRDQNLEMVHGFEEEYLGSIFIRESIGRMTHFDNHFLDLLANPKKEQLLFTFMKQCGPNSAQCLRLINSFDRTVAANTMQAILAIVGGFARMRNETCPHEQGICNTMLESAFHKNLLSYILNTRSMRIDSQSDRRFKSDHFDVFEFAPDGSSGRDIEILNFKHDFTNGLFRFDTVALYMHETKSLIRNPNVRYLFYKYNGVIDGHKEYNETELISSDCVNLKKCTQCEPQTPEFIYMPSWDNLLLTGVFDVHQHLAQNPLICQKNYTLIENVQNVEAFLWTIDLINKDPNILPGVHLGALIFDTCSSYQKIYRDISNFLSNSLLLGDSNVQMPTPESVVGFLVDGKNTKIMDSILDLTNPLKISVLASEARESKYNNAKQYSQYLGFSLPISIHVDAILKLLQKYSWNFVSVLYENNLTEQQHSDAFEYLVSKVENFGIRLAAKELFDESNIGYNVQHLKKATTMGSKVIIIFLSEHNLKKWLQFNEEIKDEKTKLLPTETVYIIIDSQSIISQKFPTTIKSNVISISQERKYVPEFNQHFLDLSLQTNIKNPWFTKLWEKVYNCEGFGCYRTSGNLGQRKVEINKKTSSVINAVYSLAHSLEIIRGSLCPTTTNGLCRNFANHMRQISRLEYDSIKQENLIGLDGSQIAFQDSNYITGHVNVLNLIQTTADDDDVNKQWEIVGQFDRQHGLIITTSKTRLLNMNGTISTFEQIKSDCQQSNKCPRFMKETNGPLVPPFMGSSMEEAQANIALITPLHSTDSNGKCGPINSDIFEKLMAFGFALDRHNHQSSFRLGALVVDSCAYNRQQIQQLASVQNFKLLPKTVSIVNMLVGNQVNMNVSNQLFNMISDYSPFVYNLYRPKSDEQQQSFFFNEKANLNDNGNHILRSIVDFCTRNKWPVVNLVYANSFTKDFFLFEANQNNVCVDKTFQVTLKDVVRPQFQNDWSRFVRSLDTQVLAVLAGSDIAEYLFKYSDKYTLENIIWVGDKNLKTGLLSAQKKWRRGVRNLAIMKKLNRDNVDLVPLSSMIDDLSKYFDVNGDRIRNKMITNWLYEYWHRKFNCLLNAKNSDCFEVKHARKTLINTKELKYIIDFGKVLANSISKFVAAKCNNSQSDDCLYNFHVRNELKNSITDELNKNNYLNDVRKVNADSNYEIELITNYGKSLNIFNSYNWLSNVGNLLNQSSTPINTACRLSCDLCRNQLVSYRNKTNNFLFAADSLQSPLSSNMPDHRTLAIVVSILSTLGMIVVLICVLYFILIFPMALGTTIIGYQILIGLFFCYLINFAYLLPSTYGLCWVREFALSIAYCVILSGLFVKVYNYWCQVLMKKSSKPTNCNSPTMLLSISFMFIVIQAVIIAFLTYKYPTSYGTFHNIVQCANVKFSFARIESLGPLALLAALFVLTCFFALKTMDNTESRWILTCSVLSALTWLGWIGFDTFFRDRKTISIVIANLVNASIFIVLLYIRKLYLFSKISRKILKERRMNMDANMQYEPFADFQQQYGAFRSCSDNISWSNIQDNKVAYRNATRSPFEGDNEDNVSSCGSVKSNTSSQVQCQELYPMEVYDNQLAQTNSRIGQSTRSVYDIIDDANMK